jgi:MOSC domain-containing protein YiiM
MTFTVEAVCISTKKGVQKHAVKTVRLLEDLGIEHDAHAGNGHRQVSLLAGEAIDTMREAGLDLEHGAFGENIVTRGIDWTRVSIGDHIRIGDAELVITQKGKECHTPCAIFYEAGRCIMPEFGIFARIKRGGVIHAGNSGDHCIR